MKISFLLVVCITVKVIYSRSQNSRYTEPQLLPFEDECPLGSASIYQLNNRTSGTQDGHKDLLSPTVFIGILVRNKAHSLPYFLRGLEMQEYDKSRIQMLFLVDNCIDNSIDVLTEWVESSRGAYHEIIMEVGDNDVADSYMWTQDHYEHLILLKQRLLNAARFHWADFFLSIDADVILMNPQALKTLVETARNPSIVNRKLQSPLPVIAPLMNCTTSEFYANFWGAMTETGYYARSDTYFEILRRERVGLFQVPMVHSIFLINLRHQLSRTLRFHPLPPRYTGPMDDLIIFARSAEFYGVPFYLDNREFYGFLPAPVNWEDLEGSDKHMEKWLEREKEIFVHLRLQAMIGQDIPEKVLPSDLLFQKAEDQLPPMSKLGFDEVYYINLMRRPDRKEKMEYFLNQLGIDARHVPAVDGKELSDEKLTEMGIKQLPGYYDPYHKRSLKFGEIGCFLSHYNLWQEMVKHEYKQILILEDDVRFAPGFVRNLASVLREADSLKPDWDLLYIGRKRMSKNERRVPSSTKLALPDYTYWTLGYVLKLSGARKLLAQDPLKKMVAVDEYLPIMFDRHPEKTWLEQFEPRDLVALSAEPLLVEPQHYTGDQLYVSDTEDSEILENK